MSTDIGGVLDLKKKNVCQSDRVRLSADFPHDVRPGQRRGADFQPHRHDAAALPLGRLPAVPGAAAAGLPARLLGVAQRDGGTSRAGVRTLRCARFPRQSPGFLLARSSSPP